MNDNDDLSMKVRFTQEFTIRPPDTVTDEVEADYWFHDDPEDILWDALDVNQGTVEVLHIDGPKAMNKRAI